jgi:D-alanyl-D-alanine carboxypeptidase/D-alanyl-D-alanine-endopeptidase (penicillin-binding protein 4)
MRRTPWLAALALAAGAAHAELPAEVQRVLTGLSISPNDVSILVQEQGAAEPVLAHLADVPRNPASVMKTVTTWSALEVLGPAYTWPTEVYFLGDFDGKALAGDLALKGYGNPYLVLEELWKLLRALRRAGLEDIEGDLVLDDTYFDVIEDDPGAFDGQPYRTYNVVPNALLVNFKAVQFQFLADLANGRVNVATDPILSNLRIRNGLKLGDGPCAAFQAGIAFAHADAEALDEVAFDGSFSRRCRGYSMSRTVLQHDTYAYGLITSLWREVGGSIRGSLRSEPVPPDVRPAMTWRSPPLGEVIRSINKNSNNVMTRQLLYTLGADRQGSPGTREKGVQAVREFLASRGLNLNSLTMTNGAGLARDERISARLLAEILQQAAASVYAPEFIASLSLGGMDGTTRGRFDDHSGNGRMHVKTGRIDHVAALAGYVHAHGGKNYVMVTMLNTQDAHRGPGQELEAALTRWVQALH